MRREDVARLEIDIPKDRRKRGTIVTEFRNGHTVVVPFSMGSNGGLVLEALVGMIITQIQADLGDYES